MRLARIETLSAVDTFPKGCANISVSGGDFGLPLQEDVWNYRLTFTHPPRNNKASLLDGVVSQEAFVKKDMKDSLKGKVRRNNNLAVEIQGAITFTAK